QIVSCSPLHHHQKAESRETLLDLYLTEARQGSEGASPNHGMEPTAYSARCAPASDSGSCPALDCHADFGAGTLARAFIGLVGGEVDERHSTSNHSATEPPLSWDATTTRHTGSSGE